MPNPQKISCEVSKIISHGNQVYTVEFIPKNSIPLFKCGQFLHLALDKYDPSFFWPESRVFSIASSPTQKSRIRISFSVKGLFTSRMEKELEIGKEVWIKLPYGDFFVDVSRPVVLVAGGTGITAFTAFIENLQEVENQSITVIYGAKNRRLFIYKDIIEKQRESIANLKAFYFMEEGKRLRMNESLGKLTIDEIWERVATPLQSDFYLSGPPAMLQAFSTELRDKGLLPSAIRIDSWE